MKPTGEDDLWPRPQFCSIYCPKCGRPAARLGGAGVTTEVLRDALTGAAKLPLQTWRAIGRALDKAEQQEGADE